MQGQHQYQPELFSQIDYENLIPKSHLLKIGIFQQAHWVNEQNFTTAFRSNLTII